MHVTAANKITWRILKSDKGLRNLLKKLGETGSVINIHSEAFVFKIKIFTLDKLQKREHAPSWWD